MWNTQVSSLNEEQKKKNSQISDFCIFFPNAENAKDVNESQTRKAKIWWTFHYGICFKLLQIFWHVQIHGNMRLTMRIHLPLMFGIEFNCGPKTQFSFFQCFGRHKRCIRELLFAPLQFIQFDLLLRSRCSVYFSRKTHIKYNLNI